jgi:hypothetical protein
MKNEKDEWQKVWNTVRLKVKHCKGNAMRTKAENSLDYTANMYSGILEMLGWRSGGGPQMLVKDGEHRRELRKIAETMCRQYTETAVNGSSCQTLRPILYPR